MYVTEWGITTFCKAVQPLKAYQPISVIELEIAICCKDLQSLYLLLVDYQYYTF